MSRDVASASSSAQYSTFSGTRGSYPPDLFFWRVQLEGLVCVGNVSRTWDFVCVNFDIYIILFCVCVCVCIYISVYIYIHILCVCIYTHKHICMYIYIYIYMYTDTHTQNNMISCWEADTYIHTYIHTYTRIYIYIKKFFNLFKIYKYILYTYFFIFLFIN